MSKFKTYAKAILIPVIVGGIVGFIISGSIDYDSLTKPPLAPPGIVFPIVWTILYVLMGISFGMLNTKDLVDSKVKNIYYTQLVINALWSIIFFTLKLRLFAFIWILLLLALSPYVSYFKITNSFSINHSIFSKMSFADKSMSGNSLLKASNRLVWLIPQLFENPGT